MSSTPEHSKFQLTVCVSGNALKYFPFTRVTFPSLTKRFLHSKNRLRFPKPG
jgi:hypothetical protein